MAVKSIAEIYLEAAESWCDLENAANLLEDTKSAIFSQMVLAHQGISNSKAELLTRASEEWLSHVTKIVDARTKANRAKIRVEYTKMRAWEETSRAADNRIQSKL